MAEGCVRCRPRQALACSGGGDAKLLAFSPQRLSVSISC